MNAAEEQPRAAHTYPCRRPRASRMQGQQMAPWEDVRDGPAGCIWLHFNFIRISIAEPLALSPSTAPGIPESGFLAQSKVSPTAGMCGARLTGHRCRERKSRWTMLHTNGYPFIPTAHACLLPSPIPKLQGTP